MSDPNKIRQRESYKRFAIILKEVLAGDPVKIMKAVDKAMDNMRAYRSSKASTFAAESLDQLLLDQRLTVPTPPPTAEAILSQQPKP